MESIEVTGCELLTIDVGQQEKCGILVVYANEREIVHVGEDRTVTLVPDSTIDELREAIMVMAPMAAEMVRR